MFFMERMWSKVFYKGRITNGMSGVIFLVSWAPDTLLFDVILNEQSEDAQSMVNFQKQDCSANYQMDTNDMSVLENLVTFVSNAKIWFDACSDNDSNVLAQDCLQHDSIAKLYSLYNSLRRNLSVQSRTSRLWIQYIQYIELLKTFLMAEWTGNLLAAAFGLSPSHAGAVRSYWPYQLCKVSSFVFAVHGPTAGQQSFCLQSVP